MPREGVMAEIRAGEHRHGMPPAPYASLYDFVRTVSQPTYLIVREGGDIVPSSRPFYTHLVENGPDFQAFLFHEHYIWNSARLRAAYGTLEVRPACQQPWPETMAAAALILGLAEALQPIMAYIQQALGEDYWQRMRIYHQQAIRHGLRAPQPAPHFLEYIVAQAGRWLAQARFWRGEPAGADPQPAGSPSEPSPAGTGYLPFRWHGRHDRGSDDKAVRSPSRGRPRTHGCVLRSPHALVRVRRARPRARVAANACGMTATPHGACGLRGRDVPRRPRT